MSVQPILAFQEYVGQLLAHSLNTDSHVRLLDRCEATGDVISEKSVFSRLSHISGHVTAKIGIELIGSTAQSLTSEGDISCYSSTISREITSDENVFGRDMTADSITAKKVDIKRCSIPNTVASKTTILADRCEKLGILSSEKDITLLNCTVLQSVRAKETLSLKHTRILGNVDTQTIKMEHSSICATLTACMQRLVLKDSHVRTIVLSYPSPEQLPDDRELPIDAMQNVPSRSNVVILDRSTIGAIYFQEPGGVVELINGAFVAHITNGRILGSQPEDLFTKGAARWAFSQICSLPYEVADRISIQLDRKAGVALALTSIEAALAAGVRPLLIMNAKKRKLENHFGKDHESVQNFLLDFWNEYYPTIKVPEIDDVNEVD